MKECRSPHPTDKEWLATAVCLAPFMQMSLYHHLRAITNSSSHYISLSRRQTALVSFYFPLHNSLTGTCHRCDTPGLLCMWMWFYSVSNNYWSNQRYEACFVLTKWFEVGRLKLSMTRPVRTLYYHPSQLFHYGKRFLYISNLLLTMFNTLVLAQWTSDTCVGEPLINNTLAFTLRMQCCYMRFCLPPNVFWIRFWTPFRPVFRPPPPLSCSNIAQNFPKWKGPSYQLLGVETNCALSWTTSSQNELNLHFHLDLTLPTWGFQTDPLHLWFPPHHHRFTWNTFILILIIAEDM